MSVPKRGDIIHLTFDPASGKEMLVKHYGLVISDKIFNSSGLAMICPILQGANASARSIGTLVTLIRSGLEIQGMVHCHQLKSLDWRVRKAEFKELTPDYVMAEVTGKLEAILFD
ncbi:MAG: type II toxin-antitoxin system PemK/MazF family toxin [Methylophilaceae bacterium]|nr:type II toxin-antitoxin system PemK/MazF family toxin [Methylophilaceae bacterium]